MKKILFLLSVTFTILLSISFKCVAQTGDFSNSYILCTEGNYLIPKMVESNEFEVNYLELTSCLSDKKSKFHSWIRLKSLTNSSFEFNLTPLNSEDDLDFAIFKITNSGLEETNFEELRCMGAGLDLSKPHLSNNCSGTSGLSNQDSDFTEDIGCDYTKNNLLQGIILEVGVEYAILIHNYHSIAGYMIDIQTEGEFSTEILQANAETNNNILGLKCNQSVNTKAGVTVYPNPFFDFINLQFDQEFALINPSVNIRMYDNLGKTVNSHRSVQLTGSTIMIPLSSNLASGMYVIEVEGVKSTNTFKVIKL